MPVVTAEGSFNFSIKKSSNNHYIFSLKVIFAIATVTFDSGLNNNLFHNIWILNSELHNLS
jgi:hypothetical protein